MATTEPLYSCRKCSSQATDSASRWLVGSSSRSRSGDCRSSRHSATRRRSPPESLVTSASGGGSRSASIACSSFESRSHAPGRFNRVLDPRLFLEDLVHLLGRQLLAELRVDFVEAREQRAHRRDALFDVAEHGLRGVELRLLCQEADGVPGRQRRFAGEIRVEAGHDPEERRLAGAVRADDADLRAVEKREPDVLKDDGVGRVNLAQPFHGVDEFRHG